jgi:DNA primase
MTDDLKELLEHLDMETYLDAEGVSYRKTRGARGEQLNVKTCPVCGNYNWKVYLNAASGLGNCFAGDHPPGENFSKWNFIKAHLGNPANRVVIARIKQFALEAGWRPARKTSVAVQAPSTDWQLPESYAIPVLGKNVAYLENRGISKELAAYFHMRICVRGWFRIKPSSNEDWVFQDYSNRILLPIYDLDGKLVTFQGRDILGTQEPKYLFPPALPGSGTFLYNALNAIRTKRVAIGEGVFDVAALKIAFDEDPSLRDVVPIGTFGKHLSDADENSQKTRLRELWTRGVRELTFMWDGEVQATDDAIRAGDIARQLGFMVRVGLLPANKDPNEVPSQVVRDTFYRAHPLVGPATGLTIRMMRRQMNAFAA